MTQWPSGMTPPIVRNQQPAEKPQETKEYIEVHSIWPTIQGEGPYAGMPAVFMRLSGCNLQCPLCDTEYTTNRKKMTPPAVLTTINAYGQGALVVITGGEPFRQDINRTVRALLLSGHPVQIETNGTLYLDDFPYSKVTVVCSPKTPSIHQRLRPDYYKYVLDADHVDKDDGLPTSALGMVGKPARPRNGEQDVTIYVQPLDEDNEEKNKRHMQAAVDSVMKYDYRLCLQVHKIAGLQ